MGQPGHTNSRGVEVTLAVVLRAEAGPADELLRRLRADPAFRVVYVRTAGGHLRIVDELDDPGLSPERARELAHRRLIELSKGGL